MSLSAYLAEFDERDWATGAEGTVRLALVGLGWWTTEEVIPAIDNTERCETTVLVTGSPEKGNAVAADVDSPTTVLTYDEFHDGTAQREYDAVYICTPNATHLEFAETAAAAGKAVLCEKPMEATVERARRLVEVCDDAGVQLAVGYRMQTEPAIRRARELIREGAIGDPLFATGTNTQTLLDAIPDPDQWRLDPDLSGYGTSVMDLGIYHVNTCRFLLDAEPNAVTATMSSAHEAFSDVPDERATFMLEFDSGVQSACTTSQNAPAKTALEITGTNGRLRIEPGYHMRTEMTVEVEGQTAALDTDDVDQMEELFAYFADVVLSGADVGPDGRDGLADMRVLEAIYDAGRSGDRVELSPRR